MGNNDKHLSHEELARYVDGLLRHKVDEVPQYIKDRIKEHPEYIEHVYLLYTILKERQENSYLNQLQKQKRRRIRKAIIIGILISLVIFAAVLWVFSKSF